MDGVVIHEAGLDIHKKQIVAICFTPAVTEMRSFGTMTVDPLALAYWLTACGVTHVAKATGVYGKPRYNVLASIKGLEVWVVNPHDIQGMPGRKTDVQDRQGIASLLRVGAVKASVIPPRPQRELRELMRYRKRLIQARTAEAHQIQKIWEGANIKLSRGVNDVLGTSGQQMLQALAQGETDPERLAALADRRLRASPADLVTALRGFVGAHQPFMLRVQLAPSAFLDRQRDAVSAEIAARLTQEEDTRTRGETLPGVGRRTAEPLIAECGTARQRFSTAAAFISWAGFSPGHNQSGGKDKPAPTRKGSPTLRTTVVEAAQAASPTRTHLALMAVGRPLMMAVYHILKTPGTIYHDLGFNYYDERDRAAVVRRAQRRLEHRGFRVTLEPLQPTG